MTIIAHSFLRKFGALFKSILCFPRILATVLQSSGYELLKPWMQNHLRGQKH